MKRSIMKIGKHKTYKAYAYDKNRQITAQLYDSGFTSLDMIYGVLCQKAFHKIRKIQIIDLDDSKNAYYKVTENGTLKKCS